MVGGVAYTMHGRWKLVPSGLPCMATEVGLVLRELGWTLWYAEWCALPGLLLHCSPTLDARARCGFCGQLQEV